MANAKVSTKQARRLYELEADVKRQRVALEDAEGKLAAYRDRIHSRVPLSTDGEERKRKVRVAVAGGIRIRITPSSTGEKFSLRTYREAGHEITPEMQESITPGKPYDRWTVRELNGASKA